MKKKKAQKPSSQPQVFRKEPEFDAEAASVDPGDKTLSAVGYLSILCILPLILRPKSQFCRFHGKQALMILIVSIPLLILGRFFSLFAGGALFLFSILVFLVQAYGLWQAWQGKKTEIPPFAAWAEKYLRWDVIEDAYQPPTEDETGDQ